MMSEQEQYLDNYTQGFAYSLIITVIFNGILTILKESIKSIHDVLALVFWHHWIGHGVIILVVFFGLGLLFSRCKTLHDARKITYLVIGATVLGVALIVVFFILENVGLA